MITPLTNHDYNGIFRKEDFYIILTATDFSGTGIFDTFYIINYGSIKRISVDGQPFISTEGINNVLEFWSRDNSGNQESVKSITQIKLDKHPPYEINDLSNLNGQTFRSTHSRTIRIHVKDNFLLANTVSLKYIREGCDTDPQENFLSLDISGPIGVYTGILDENPDPERADVTCIKYWIEGTDAAGNEITIGGSKDTPLAQYLIDDVSPVFVHNYTPNERIGQTSSVKNNRYANSYANNQTVNIEVCLNKSSFIITADFSVIDSNYSGQETVNNLGNGKYNILYTVSPTNTIDIKNASIKITADDGFGHSSSDSSFLASTNFSLALLSISPDHNSSDIGIDDSHSLQFNANIINDGLLTGHIYLTNECNEGVPIDIFVNNNIVTFCPVYRLSPDQIYVIHINPDLPAQNIGPMDHYNEIVFTTGEFFPPLVPKGYMVYNANDLPLTIDDSSLKITNGSSISITWQKLGRQIINGSDLRDFPIMTSNKNNALIWAEGLPDAFASPPLPAIIEIANLSLLNNPKVSLSQNGSMILLGGIIKDTNILQSYSFFNKTLQLSIKQIRSIFISESLTPKITADGQDSFIRIAWTYPSEIDVGYSVLVRNQNEYPDNILDGEKIYEGNGNVWYDIGLSNTITQMYRLFAFDDQSKQYNYIDVIEATPNKEYKISYDYGTYEANLLKKLPSFGDPTKITFTACDNAVADIANNGNDRQDEIPIFNEYKLGKNKNDKRNLIVSNCENSIVVELDRELASELKNACCLLIVCENEAAIDYACNSSLITMFTDCLDNTDSNEFSILHTVPIIKKLCP